MKCVMVPASRSGQTMRSTKVNGEKIRPTVKESFGMQMEIYMKENGRMTRPTDTVSIFT